jgi:FeS assembly SUF system regulator
MWRNDRCHLQCQQSRLKLYGIDCEVNLMLRITKETDYGITLVAFVAGHSAGEILTARQASEWSGLPLPTVSKIMRSLAREKILISHRGVSGGYSLARPAAETSVAEIIRALQGPISFVQCGAEPGVCEQEKGCPTRANWTRISKTVEKALDSVSITDMVGRPSSTSLLSIGEEK